MEVLIGTGGSEAGLRALDAAIERAREAGDTLTVAVLDRDDAGRSPADVESAVRERLAAAGLQAEVRRLEGHPASRLVEVADGDGFDRVVIPGGEHSPLGKIKIDDFTEFVVLNAETTVTLVR